MSRTPLAPEDAARLHMDLPENRMIIVAALELDARLDQDALLELLRVRLLSHVRFRQRVMESAFGLGVPYWQEDTRFELARHVHRHGPSSRPLLERIAEVANRELARDKPLWEMHVFEGDETDVLVARVHHVLADGTHLVRILEDLADDHLRGAERTHARTHVTRGRGARIRRLIGGVAGAVRLFRAGADPRSSLSGKLGNDKRLCASPTLSLDALHGAARESGLTITELLLSSISGALRDRVHGVVHALVPMALRSNDDDAGNRYVSVFVPLPVAIDDRKERARLIACELRALRERQSSTSSSGVRLTSAAGAATALVERAGVRLFSKRATLMVSVVRGPVNPIRLAGARVRDVMVWAPVPGTIAVGITMMSYAGRVRLGLNADALVVRDPERLLSCILRELED